VGALSEFRGTDSTKLQEFNTRALEISPPTSMVEYHMAKKNRKVVKDQVVNFVNGRPK